VKIVRQLLIVLAALALFAGADAKAQTINSTTSESSGGSRPDEPGIFICSMADDIILGKIVLGRPGQMELRLGGDWDRCVPGGWDWTFEATSASVEGEDFIDEEKCPAFRTQIDKLHTPRPPVPHGFDTAVAVRAGPFVITDWSDLFHLHRSKGRTAAARWVRQTLIAVRPCWNNVREDRKHPVVDRLYKDFASALR
jgi:hypothetical protein